MLLKYFLALFAITNPIGNLVVFIGLTSDRTKQEQRAITFKTALAILVIFLLSTWIGGDILSFFNISVPSFELAGGLVLIIMGISMLHTKQPHASYTDSEHADAKEKETISIVPLAIPLIGGPGAIATIIIYVRNNPSLLDKVSFSLVNIAIAAIIAIFFLFSSPISKCLGSTGAKILTRIMGILIIAMAMQMILHGLGTSFPMLLK